MKVYAMTDYIFYTIETASEEAKPILEGIQESYGFIPNMFAYMAEAPKALEAYLSLNNIVESTSFTPAQQQIALLAASVENDCDFCTVAHCAIGKMNQVEEQTLKALPKKNHIENMKDAMLAKFTQAVVSERGRPPESVINEFLGVGFTKRQMFEVMIIVSIKTLSNYTNHLTIPSPNDELVSMG